MSSIIGTSPKFDMASPKEAQVDHKSLTNKKTPWSEEEIDTLVKLKAQGVSLEQIGKELSRSAEACRLKLYRRTHLSAKESPWTPQCVTYLKQLKEEGLSWEEISQNFPRTPRECQRKWEELKAQNTKKWPKKLNYKLLKAVAKFRYVPRRDLWDNVSIDLGGDRDAKCCEKHFYKVMKKFQRFMNYLKP